MTHWAPARIVSVMTKVDTPTRCCNSCGGTGRVPISHTARLVLSQLEGAKEYRSTLRIYQAMAPDWRKRYGRTTVNSALELLRAVGAVTRRPASRGYQWRAVELAYPG